MKFTTFLLKVEEINRRMDGNSLRLIGLNERLEGILRELVRENGGDMVGK